MSWDITTPDGNENKALGASRIREAKAAQETALQAEGIFPGADTAIPVYIPTIPYGLESSRPSPNTDLAGRWYYNTTTGTIQRDTGSAWENVTAPINIIPVGTKMVFFEASAPTGWTQVTTGIGDRLIRMASTGGVAVAGNSVETPPTHVHNTDVASNTTHKHTVTIVETRSNDGATEIVNSITLVSNLYTGEQAISHVHSLPAIKAYAPRYLNVIVCTKD